MDWNKEISKKMEVGILIVLWLSILGCHWLISGFFYDTLNTEWTRMEIFGFLAWAATMIFMVIIALTIFRKEAKPRNKE